jgi:putative YphP/YqiW family bacilliredoxin
MYPVELTSPMKAELTGQGFQSLESASDVDNILSQKEGTTLLFVNSVCGCAAGSARPGILMALRSEAKKPGKLTTVFAGVDGEATQQARSYMLPYPPSSPAIALFKDGELVHMVERHHIEGRSAEVIGRHMEEVFNHFC